MKKIGIVTMAFRSQNYGGVLQAFALTKYLNSHGFMSEIIRYDYSSPQKEESSFERFQSASLSEKVIKIFRHFKTFPQDFLIKILSRIYKKPFKKRATAFERFHQNHMSYSKNVFSWRTIKSCASHYDIFITGSDQVWNEGFINDVFLLNFTLPMTPKLSYAASIAQDVLSETQKNLLRSSLRNFKAVSVREAEAVKQLETLQIKASLVLDPTLLLDKKEWETLSSKKLVEGHYVFCYFLGSSRGIRKEAAAFAKKIHLKIVTLPYILGQYRICDRHFGDEKLYNVSPPDFLSLIQYADYVLTDSFHGCIFAYLFQKQFFVFDRVDRYSYGMTSRLNNLLDILDLMPRLCNTKEKVNADYLTALPSIDYTVISEKFIKIKEKSEQFLHENLRT